MIKKLFTLVIFFFARRLTNILEINTILSQKLLESLRKIQNSVKLFMPKVALSKF